MTRSKEIARVPTTRPKASSKKGGAAKEGEAAAKEGGAAKGCLFTLEDLASEILKRQEAAVRLTDWESGEAEFFKESPVLLFIIWCAAWRQFGGEPSVKELVAKQLAIYLDVDGNVHITTNVGTTLSVPHAPS